MKLPVVIISLTCFATSGLALSGYVVHNEVGFSQSRQLGVVTVVISDDLRLATPNDLNRRPTPGDARVRLLGETAGQLAEGESATKFMLHTFSDYTGIQQPTDRITQGNPRYSGFAISVLEDELAAEPSLLWARPHVRIHVPGQAGWEPVVQDIGTLWWDDRTNTLWLAFAITTGRQSMIHVDQLTMQIENDSGETRSVEFAQSTHQFNHVRGDLDRIERMQMHPSDSGGIVLEIIHLEEPSTTIKIAVAEKPTPTMERRYRQFKSNLPGLEQAIRQEVRREQSLE